jgi:AmmeMemoRadiSam system protein A
MTDADRESLLDAAREAISELLLLGRSQRRARATPVLTQTGGAFVSTYVGGKLRGCIGHLESDMPLGEVVARCARAASTEDPRFAPLTIADLPELALELSILGPFERVTVLHEIEIGAHGLLVEDGRQRGLLLPQVATKYQWDAQRFVQETCHKAGLPRDAWCRGAALWRFTARVVDGPFTADERDRGAH